MSCRPSELLNIQDGYTAFCFDEACAMIVMRMKDGEKPVMKVGHEEKLKKPSDLYRKFST